MTQHDQKGYVVAKCTSCGRETGDIGQSWGQCNFPGPEIGGSCRGTMRVIDRPLKGVKHDQQLLEDIASMLLNRRGGRRGAPPIENVLRIVPPDIREAAIDDARSVVDLLVQLDAKAKAAARVDLAKAGEVIAAAGMLAMAVDGYIAARTADTMDRLHRFEDMADARKRYRIAAGKL